MYKFKNKTCNLTDRMVERLLYEVDCYCEIPGNDIADVLMMFREFEHKSIKGLHKRFLKAYPYDYNAKMALSTDISPATLRRIINKK